MSAALSGRLAVLRGVRVVVLGERHGVGVGADGAAARIGASAGGRSARPVRLGRSSALVPPVAPRASGSG